ncbi:hypothetical protein QWM81_12830 [Streptomyces ficellus]|uniref:Uncharacterized protein n=1 Tax=Streptomyces ficellus TaxID=1977088 RepID=A0ABT7Z5Z2_9ACTN|nr:hypothetical protein [Streptomyces ficellus]MDN3294920.1 hypothetical protein [Streptomyces ficellus]
MGLHRPDGQTEQLGDLVRGQAGGGGVADLPGHLRQLSELVGYQPVGQSLIADMLSRVDSIRGPQRGGASRSEPFALGAAGGVGHPPAGNGDQPCLRVRHLPLRGGRLQELEDGVVSEVFGFLSARSGGTATAHRLFHCLDQVVFFLQ